ncbi:oligosaccharide flippase family protein [Vibrio alginolyticus]|uniref:lipopolysaccharide biosynthesis protein n=1 Tax=Vibrio alginolyticus TaxID=663 RepID=UPI00215D548D|nr:oligosaccharide flippase family protein [Vibrio alginolyticus]MCR9393961.1 oligosaccharide flippase family protein [Vibrio alginolyticus]MCS0193520.1 oligosaccharide flippase family protein [Vibrio alginolyticus]
MNIFKSNKNSEVASVFKGMLTLAKGAVFARIIGLVSIPVLTRIYSPEDYGVLALYTSLIAILAPIFTFRYVQAIPLPKTDKMAINLFSVCLALILMSSLFIAVILFFFSETILNWFDMRALAPWWPVIVLGAAGTALYELFSLWATRKKQYKIIAKTQVTQSFFGNLTKILMGLFSFKPAGLLIGQFIAQSGGVGSFIKQSLPDFIKLKSQVTKSRSTFISSYYRGFPVFRLPSQILMSLSLQAPTLMMAALFSKESTGQLSLAMVALNLPITLIVRAVSKAYYAEISSIGKNNIEKIRRITFSVQKKLFLIGFPLTIVTMFVAEYAFVVIFGSEWLKAGQMAVVLAPFMLLQFTSLPLIEAINVVGSQIHFLILSIVRVLGLIIMFVGSIYFHVQESTFLIMLSAYLTLFYLFTSFFVVFSMRK